MSWNSSSGTVFDNAMDVVLKHNPDISDDLIYELYFVFKQASDDEFLYYSGYADVVYRILKKKHPDWFRFLDE